MYRVGDRVVAAGSLTEENFNGPGVHEHARAEDVGTVGFVDAGGWPVVRFDRTGTATLCDPVLDVRPLLTGGQ